MASFEKRKDGRWRALVWRNGVRKSKILPSRQEARDWAARLEWEILNREKTASGAPFGDIMDRYARERSGAKRGARWEVIRLEKLGRDRIARVAMGDLSAADFADWRDRRLREVAPGSVLREMQLLNSVLTVAHKEWGLINSHPMADVRRPSKPPARDRLVTPAELERLAYASGDRVDTLTGRAFHCFLFALETAMRAGEIAALRWPDIDLDIRVARLHHTKNGHPRDVPLSSEAVRLLQALPELDPVFGLSTDQISSLFRKIKDRAGIVGLTFHDSRHSAITRLSRKLDVLALARMVGHKDLRQLNTYYNETAADLAKRLD